MDNLILTGWFWKDYAIAGAVALRHYKKADIYGVSTHRLPEMLNEVGNKYKEIAILGVGLSGNAELLEKALTKLQKTGIHIRWISALDFPEYIGDNIRKKLDSFICYDDGITEAVSQCFNQRYDDIAPLASQDVPKNLRSVHELLEAAMYFYRNFQDERAYGMAIYHIAHNEPESRWGSCSSRNNINYNWRVSLAPNFVINYLIAHEVAHLLHQDHSPAFWDTVKQLCPRYKQGRDWLKENGRTLYSYR